MKSVEELTILIFAPHSAIWVHAFPEALIAESLQQKNNRIIYITCNKEFQNYCVCMSAYGLTQASSQDQKEQICKICNDQKEIIKKKFNFQGYDLSEVITTQDRETIQTILDSTTLTSFLDLKLDTIEVGRTALYELLLQYKKTNLDFSPTEWSNYLIALKNTLTSFFACRHILEKEKPDRILTYNSLYSVNRVCCQLAELRNIPTYFLHAGGNLSNRLQTMWLGEGTTFKFNQRLRDSWQVYKDIPCSQDSLNLVTNHFLELFKGQHFLAYSSAKNTDIDIRQFFEIQSDQKILVATMSSYDERFAGETINVIPKHKDLIFPRQIDWIQSLIEFVKERQDLFLIIRVHPREFPNKRDSVCSEHSKMLQQALTDLPTNIKLNLPTDNLSIYDLADCTDLFLNAWSSVGEEMSIFGIPVLIYSPDLVFYPSDINYLAMSKEDFFDKIDIALADGWSFEKIRITYRWYVLKHVRSVFNLSESIKWQESQSFKDIKGRNRLANLVDSIYILFNRVYFKILSKLTKAKNHVSYNIQLEDCRQRALSLKDSNKINELIQGEKNILLDLIDYELGNDLDYSIDLELETSFIKHEISRMFQDWVNIDGKNVKSPLRTNLLNAIKSK